MKNIKKIVFGVVLFSVCFLNNVYALNDDVVAYIGEKEYDNFDNALNDALNDSNDSVTISLVEGKDIVTEGINLTKNIIILGKGNNITFTKYGISLWGKSLTFSNVNISMVNVLSTPYTAEWNWVTICGSNGSSLILDNTTLLMDANKADRHAIYFTGDNLLEIKNGSRLTIQNYGQDALEWNGSTGGKYNLIIDKSTVEAYNNRSGIAGTFTVDVNESNLYVNNNIGNGTNGSNFNITNSTVTFNDNGSHGLSSGSLVINDSNVTANGNGANGIHTGNMLSITNNSTITIRNNKCTISSKWTIPGALYVGGVNSIIDSTTNLDISDNNGSGIYVKDNASLRLEAGSIVRNIAKKLGIGGGINNHGTLTISNGVNIYNNYASVGADDIYNSSNGSITISDTLDDWKLILNRNDDEYLNDCEDLIDGWYEDGVNMRYSVHSSNKHVEKITDREFSDEMYIKAAHNIYGKVIVRYIDTKDNSDIIDPISMIYEVGSKYDTIKKEFDGYTYSSSSLNTHGEVVEEDTYVYYYYDRNIGGGEEIPPKTGLFMYDIEKIDTNNIDNTVLESVSVSENVNSNLLGIIDLIFLMLSGLFIKFYR